MNKRKIVRGGSALAAFLASYCVTGDCGSIGDVEVRPIVAAVLTEQYPTAPAPPVVVMHGVAAVTTSGTFLSTSGSI